MSEPEDQQTKLPEINNSNNQELNGFISTTKTNSKENKRNVGPIFGITQSMSKHSSRKSVPISNNLQSTAQPMLKNKTLNDAK